MNRKWIFGAIASVLIGVIAIAMVGAAPQSAGQPAPVTRESSVAFRAVVKKVLPSVVSIVARAKPQEVAKQDKRQGNSRDPREFRRFFEGPMTPDDLRRFFEEFGDMEFHPRTPLGGFGSGVIISADGVVVTNNHVVQGAERVDVFLQDGRRFTANKVLTDPKTDVAIVKLSSGDASNLPFAALGDSSLIETGDWILAMGSPFGPELSGSVTAGIVSAKGRAPRELNLLYEDFIQTDAAINPGNSGGPIVNLDGQIVGINTAIRTETGTFAGIGFAIPSNLVKEVVDQLLKHGKVIRSYVGIQMGSANQGVLENLGLKHGVQIGRLTDSETPTPATKAGLQPGDIIVQVDGRDVKDSKELQSLVSNATPGTKLNFKLNRNKKLIDVPVTVEQQPDDFGPDRPRSLRSRPAPTRAEPVQMKQLGIQVAAATPELAQRFGHDANAGGVLVIEVSDGGLADEAGLSAGDLILQVEQKAVRTPEELQKLLAGLSLKDGILMKVASADGAVALLVIKEK